MRTIAFFSSNDEITRRRLDDSVLPAFDCGRDEQNRFLHEWAWRDQDEWLSTTHLYFVRGILVAYATVAASSVVLGTREKPQPVRHKSIGALKLLQLGVDRHFQGRGLANVVIADVISLARILSRRAGCRYLTLDAKPDLTGWYETRGFRINKIEQKQRIEAMAGERPLEELAVSMRFDLLDNSFF